MKDNKSSTSNYTLNGLQCNLVFETINNNVIYDICRVSINRTDTTQCIC
jgi:hypothetical protein